MIPIKKVAICTTLLLGVTGNFSGAEMRGDSLRLRLARSRDASKFTVDDRFSIGAATSPTLAKIPNGLLLALYDVIEDVGESNIVAITSSTHGRNWSKPQRIQFEGLGDLEDARQPALLGVEGGVRLFFIARIKVRSAGQREGPRLPWELRSAFSSDGVRFKLESRRIAKLQSTVDVDLAAVKSSTGIHLYSREIRSSRKKGGTNETIVRHFVSRDGKRFLSLKPLDLPADVAFDGSILSKGRELRAWVSKFGHVHSMESRDGIRWKLRSGDDALPGLDAAVMQTPEGYVMIFQEVTAPESAEALAALRLGNSFEQDDFGAAVDAGAPVASDDSIADGNVAEPIIDDFLEEVEFDEDFELDPGMPPEPTYDQTIDYSQWFLVETEDLALSDAADAYEEFLPNPETGAFSEWPEFKSMFHGDESSGPPQPWDPRERPEWQASGDAAQGLLDRFSVATAKDGAVAKYRRDDKPKDVANSEDGLLFNILLPALTPHRDLSRATMAEGWRLREGRISTSAMLNSWKTVLRGAAQLDRGVTLIEDLVAIAERQLVHESARWALHQELFTASETLQALGVLQQLDVDDEDLGRVMKFEHAAQMDILQYMFTPPTPNGIPQLNSSKVPVLQRFFGGQDENWRARVLAMKPDDAYATADAVNAYFSEISEMMRIGYPLIREADIDALAEKYQNASPLTEEMLPSLSRYYHLHARSIASRRATQLAFAMRVFKSKQGRWPRSLEELPETVTEETRMDPFSGDYFGYKLTPQGPLLYSVGENGVDDGGVHSPRWGSPAAPGEAVPSDDHVFWPPQAPPPKK